MPGNWPGVNQIQWYPGGTGVPGGGSRLSSDSEERCDPGHSCGRSRVNERRRSWLASRNCFLSNVWPLANFDRKASAIACGSAFCLYIVVLKKRAGAREMAVAVILQHDRIDEAIMCTVSFKRVSEVKVTPPKTSPYQYSGPWRKASNYM